ncbi:MAG: nitrous oxide reductase accessory protein NosL [Gemmatimonadaceae bacterium]|nr:nitrous oxide reductase accessory protein NosL [Gemmatimonadaceae bacterium]
MTRLRPASILSFALTAALAGALASTTACTSDAPRAVVEGEDLCAECHMGIADLRFAAQARTSTGKVLLFDSIECLADYLAANDSTAAASLHVTDYRAPGTWLPAASALFVLDGRIASPMGRSLAAFAANASPAALVAEHGGRVVTWDEVRALVATGSVTSPHAHAHAP